MCWARTSGATTWVPEQRGFVALGVPIGHTDFVKAQAAIRLDAEADLLRKLTQLPISSAPGSCSLSARRLVHSICSETYPRPTSCRTLAVTTMRSGQSWKACSATKDPARETTGLLLASVSWQRNGYHRQHSGRRVLRQRYPDAAARLVQELEGEPASLGLRAAAEAACQLTAEGWTSRPDWASCARCACR